MPRLNNSRLPKLRHHKRSDKAYVVIDGCAKWLGPWHSAESQQRYHSLIAAWLENNSKLPVVHAAPAPALRVRDIVAAFMRHAIRHYVNRDGCAANEIENYRQVCRLLLAVAGNFPAAEFGPRRLCEARDWMISGGWTYRDPKAAHDPTRRKTAEPWTRRSVNRQVVRLRHVFRWAASQELVPARIYEALRTIEGLRAGRGEAIESEPVKPANEAAVERVKAHLPPMLADMVQVQALTGMRSGELCAMTGAALDRAGEVWQYRPIAHKTQHHGHERVVLIGPRAQAILAPYVLAAGKGPIFRPSESEKRRLADRSAARVTPLLQGNRPGYSKRTRARQKRRVGPGDCYTPDSYRRAVERACAKAFPAPQGLSNAERRGWRKQHRFHPHQLRHLAATRIRREHGLEAAQVVLGHRHARITEVYAEANVEAARSVMSRVG